MEALKNKIEAQIQLFNTKEEKLQAITDTIEKELENYDWVGFYFKNGDKPELKLAQYTGEETDHTIIPFGKGICGQVAVSNENFVVDDVHAQDNYIACSIYVKSEIVVPIFKDGENIGQIDIDSKTASAFSEKDERFLEDVCKMVATFI